MRSLLAGAAIRSLDRKIHPPFPAAADVTSRPMPAPCRFRRSTLVNAPVAEVFRFHEDPANINVVSPSFLRVRVLRAGVPARAGEDFELALRLFGLPVGRWHGRWLAVRENALLADWPAKPLRFLPIFRHRHEFAPAGPGRTRLTDEVVYALPGGWLGKLLGETVLRLNFALAFADRHRRARRHWSPG